VWEKLLDAMLRRFIRRGTLVLYLPDGRVIRHGDGGPPQVTVRLSDPTLPRRLVQNVDLAVGEGYMDGTLTVDGDDLHLLLELGIRNIERGNLVWWQRALEALRRATRVLKQFNPAFRARRNVAHHYDLSGELYDLFLDEDRQYSCGYFRTPADTLETAQNNKKAHIAAKLLLAPGMRVLDIGCGWGGLALKLARDHGVRVLGITLSEEQQRIATRRAVEAGLDDRVQFRLTDYRDIEDQFDRIVSVGMFEHVGAPHYRTFFRKVHDRLSPEGIALIHTIGRASPPGATSPWIAKYIFPGGYVPALSEIMQAVEHEALWPTDVEIWRLHYAETLRLWGERFEANAEKARALYDERFWRMWRYYLASCEQTFRFNRQCVFQLQLARRQDAVPLTRDYLYLVPMEQLAHAAE